MPSPTLTAITEPWPPLPQRDWSTTCSTLQLWIQIIGKIRLALTPPINQCWNVTLYPTVRGFTTSPMPCGPRMLQIDFDFLDHTLLLATNLGERTTIPLQAMSVAEFYARVMEEMDRIGCPVHIWPKPVEVASPIPFEQDNVHCSYDPDYAQRFWRVVLQSARVFTEFRARFQGKVSPVHLFWGALDLACTRFSGRTAPEHKSMPGLPDRVTRDAYSHEVSSCGFWPGAPGVDAMFYSYAYPEPQGYASYPIEPPAAAYNKEFGEFVLPYEAVRRSTDSDGTLLTFLQSTYEAAANLAHWDRAALEVDRPPA
jgi:hypothetical protein